MGAAGVLLIALAVGCVVTSRLGRPGTDADGASRRLRALAPAGSRCTDGDRAGVLRCIVGEVVVEYELRAIVPVSAGGRTWSRPGRPRTVAGRFAGRVVHGVATMWWTVADAGLLARATARNGDLAALLQWWRVHPERRPSDLP
jgi:hypothetical protein